LLLLLDHAGWCAGAFLPELRDELESARQVLEAHVKLREDGT
jgi:hypothetical protein